MYVEVALKERARQVTGSQRGVERGNSITQRVTELLVGSRVERRGEEVEEKEEEEGYVSLVPVC